jgi:transposase InsO family protein
MSPSRILPVAARSPPTALDRLGQPGDLGLRPRELRVGLVAAPARLRARQGVQRSLLGHHPDDERRPILLALSDNGPQMTSEPTREFMALHAIAMHLGRPGVPTDQAHIESFFGHLKTEFPYLEQIDDPAVLRTALVEVRRFYNDVRLHEALDYVTPSDEHHGRGPAIRQARRDGLEAARQQRLDYHRQQRANQGRQEAQDAG